MRTKARSSQAIRERIRGPTGAADASRHSGFTIIEMLIYVTLLLILGGPIVSAILVSTRAMAENDVLNRITERNRVILSRVSFDVRNSIAGTTVIGTGNRSVQVTLAIGVDASGVIPGDAIRYELVPATGESVNGVDDNADGLVDEGRLVRRNLSTGEVIAIASELNIARSGFTLQGDSVAMQITNFARPRGNGDLMEVSRQLTAVPRN